MKKLIKTFKLLFPALLLLQASLFAQENENKNENKKKYDFVKTKSVNKSYSVSSSDKLNIQNSFGSVEVKTWDKNEIQVDVDIEVSANTDALAQKIVDRISVKEDRAGKEISFKTDVNDIHNSKDDKNSKDNKSTMQINYSIYMPANNPLKIKNDFGPITIPDYRGEVELTSTFGSLTTGNLTSIKSINVEFGKANLANISSAPVTIKFSKAVVSKLSGSVKLNLEFCNNVRLTLDNSLTSLDLKTSYSTVNLKPLGELPATYNISTSFSTFKNRSAVKFSSDKDDENNEDRYGPKFDYEYSGKSGSGNIPVKVKVSFGKIIVGEATEEDMKGKEKSKTKSKPKTS
jgi:hypothetical protein